MCYTNKVLRYELMGRGSSTCIDRAYMASLNCKRGPYPFSKFWYPTPVQYGRDTCYTVPMHGQYLCMGNIYVWTKGKLPGTLASYGLISPAHLSEMVVKRVTHNYVCDSAINLNACLALNFSCTYLLLAVTKATTKTGLGAKGTFCIMHYYPMSIEPV